MRTYLTSVLMAVAVLTTTSHAGAQTEKAKGEINRLPHSETAYHAAAGTVYRRHARDHARVMNECLNYDQPVREEVLREHVTAIRSNVDASKKHDAKLRSTTKIDASAEKLAATIEQCDAKALAQCEMLERESVKGTANATVIHQFCAEIEKELTTAEKADKELAHSLKLEPTKPVTAAKTATAVKPHAAAKPVVAVKPDASTK